MKLNKKQKNIMKVGATILFSISLILILNIVFNKNKTKEYVGVWFIGYKYYKDSSKNELAYELTQELHLVNDNTFYTKVISTDETKNGKSVFGTYKIDGNEITLTYNNNESKKTEKVILNNNKLCLSKECVRYYTKDKLEVYFDMAQKKNNYGEN